MNLHELRSGPCHHIRVFRTGECRIAPQFSYKHIAQDRDHSFYLYVTVITRTGLTAIVDTGLENVAEMNRGAGFLMTELITQAPEEDIQAILCKAGLRAEEVDYVFLTHCHYDHCSNLPLFQNARVVIPQKAFTAWHADPESARYLHAGFLEYMDELYRQDRLLLEDDGLVAPGLGVRWVGGHSVCSQFIYVHTEQGICIFTGDTVQMYGNMEQGDIVAICENEQECWQSLEITRLEADLVLPGHDPLILERYPDGRVV